MSDQTILASLQRTEYIDVVKEHIENKVWVEKLMLEPAQRAEWKGESTFTIPCQTQYPESVLAGRGVIDEPATVGGTKFAGPYDSLTEYYLFLEMTAGLRELFSKGQPNAADINVFEREMDGVLKVAALDFDFYLAQGGATGALGVITAFSDANNTITMVSNMAIRPGMTLDIFHGTSSKVAANVVVKYKDPVGKALVTCEAADLSGLSAGDVVYKAGLHSAAVTNVVPYSFLDLVKSTGSIHNTVLATNPWFASFELGNGGALRDVSFDILTEGLSLLRDSGEEIAPVAICNSDLYNAVNKRMREEQSPTVHIPKKDGVPSGIKYEYLEGDTTFRAWPTFAPNTLLCIDPQHFRKYGIGKDGWMMWENEKGGGGSALYKVAGKLVQRAVYRIYRQYVNTRPRAALRFNDLNGWSEE